MGRFKALQALVAAPVCFDIFPFSTHLGTTRELASRAKASLAGSGPPPPLVAGGRPLRNNSVLRHALVLLLAVDHSARVSMKSAASCVN